MKRDDALALSRAIGKVVALSVSPPFPSALVGTVAGTDILGRVILTDVTTPTGKLGRVSVPMADVRAWTDVS